jgi:DNA repair photolyase
MRWQAQTLDDAGEAPALVQLSGLVRIVRTPEFAGVTFHEVHAKSALNRIPAMSQVPFEWTVNTMRGCVHRCTYCFARRTHEYLEFDAGKDFDTQIVVKVNVADVLHRELARSSWQRKPVALGTNTDPYQRPEGRYRLMPGVIDALAGSGTPFSILTKGTLLKRDLPALTAAAEQVPVSVAISLALLDPDIHGQFEPGTPTPRARLELIRAVRAAGLDCSVMVAPVLPHLTDSTEALDALFGELESAGATHVTVLALHLRPGTKEWFLQNLARDRPDLVPAYRRLYPRGAYLGKEYTTALAARVAAVRARHRFEPGHHRVSWRPPVSEPVRALEPQQVALF